MSWTRGWALALGLTLGTTEALAQTVQPPTGNLTFVGTAMLKGAAADQAAVGNFISHSPEVDVSFAKSQTIAPVRVPADRVPRPAGNAVMSLAVAGFPGLTHRDQRLAPTGVPGGEQFSLEPSSLALAAGNGFVVEAVNNAIAVYDTSGKRLARQALSVMFNLPPALLIDPLTDRVTFGPVLTSPRVFYDWDTGHFFLTELEIDADPDTGNFSGASKVFIALSLTNDPRGSWNVFALDVTADGDERFGPCPCLGDQPLIGADKHGFYVSTNAFEISTLAFRGAQVYAFPKAALAAGTLPAAIRFHNLTQAEGPGFTIQPATVPPNGSFELSSGGTEYFVSSLDFTGALDDRLAVWALTNTSSLDSIPDLQLTSTVIAVEVYGQPPDSLQPSGPTPLRDFLASSRSPFGIIKNHLESVTANDDRMQQVVFADGKLWTALSTIVKTGDTVRTGAAYFILAPSLEGSEVSATVVRQGYVAINSSRQNSAMFPSVAVNPVGKGAIALSVIGQDYFPSAAYVSVDAANGAGPIVIFAPGVSPDDGATGYAPFGFKPARWGDYSAAVADESGSIWLAGEFIPNAPRTLLANWGTFIAQVNP